jgi:hypothetical protein
MIKIEEKNTTHIVLREHYMGASRPMVLLRSFAKKHKRFNQINKFFCEGTIGITFDLL